MAETRSLALIFPTFVGGVLRSGAQNGPDFFIGGKKRQSVLIQLNLISAGSATAPTFRLQGRYDTAGSYRDVSVTKTEDGVDSNTFTTSGIYRSNGMKPTLRIRQSVAGVVDADYEIVVSFDGYY